jgi:glycosyltransferase involved in cell wall biosynthesis
LELRSAWGAGGGPEKTILQGAARTDPSRFAVTVCYLRDARDAAFGIDVEARQMHVDYVEVKERHSYDLRAWGDVRRLLRERHIDIVQAHEYKTDLIAAWLKRAERIVPLATVHGWSGSSWRESLYYACDKRLLRSFPCTVAVSTEIAATLLRVGVNPARIRTIVNGIDATLYHRDVAQRSAVRDALRLRPDDYVVGAVGRLEREKRFDVLLRAVASLRTRRSDVYLVIAGAGSLVDELGSMAAQLGIAERCRFLGHRHDVIGLHQALDLYVQSSDHEGTSNSVLEAMAMETPIVATRVAGTLDLIREDIDGLLVAPRDPQALALAIERCCAEPQAAARRCAAARARVENELSFDRRQRAIESVYAELMAGRRS